MLRLQFDRLKMIEQRYDAGRLQIYRQGDQRHSGGQRRCCDRTRHATTTSDE
jgi:hypothetical protein